jgi:hypothetical protein
MKLISLIVEVVFHDASWVTHQWHAVMKVGGTATVATLSALLLILARTTSSNSRIFARRRDTSVTRSHTYAFVRRLIGESVAQDSAEGVEHSSRATLDVAAGPWSCLPRSRKQRLAPSLQAGSALRQR